MANEKPTYLLIIFVTGGGAVQLTTHLTPSEVIARWRNPSSEGICSFDSHNQIGTPVQTHLNYDSIIGFNIGEMVERHVQTARGLHVPGQIQS